MEIDLNPSVFRGSNGLLRAGTRAFKAAETVFTAVHDLDAGELGLRIGTPFAAEGTSLQKHGGPYAGAIVDGKLLNIKNNSFWFHINHFSSFKTILPRQRKTCHSSAVKHCPAWFPDFIPGCYSRTFSVPACSHHSI